MTSFAQAAGLSLIALAALNAPVAAQANVAGTWTLTVESPEGPADMVAVLAQDGATVTGTVEADQIEDAELSEGMVDGNALSFLLTVYVQGQSFTLEVAGEIDGDTMTGSMTVPEFGSFPFDATRSGG